MLRELARGAAAGALGAAALNMTTYGDMAIRGRSASDLPAQTAAAIAKKANVPLQMEGEKKAKKESREQGIGALLGFASGVTVGALYGVVRERLPAKAVPFAGFGVGALATLTGNAPQVGLGLSNPKEWGAKGWAADLIPHMVYGFVTVGAYEAMRDGHPEAASTPPSKLDTMRAKLRA